jgi:hypothetical protein
MWRCAVCGEESEDQYDACWKCGNDRTGRQSGESEVTPPSDAVPDEIPDAEESAGLKEPLTARLALGLIGAIILTLAGWYLASVEAFLEDSLLEILAHGLGYMSFGLACLTLAYGISGQTRKGRDSRVCPSCHEIVAAAAYRCPHCLLPLRIRIKDCPECQEPINFRATRCPWCTSAID